MPRWACWNRPIPAVVAAWVLHGSREASLNLRGAYLHVLSDLLGGDTELAQRFMGGTFATIYLAPHNYHRIHMPCDGRLTRMLHVPGDLFSVNPPTARGIPGLFARNERLVGAIADDLVAQGLEVLFDDRRGVSPGVKFKDAELLGMPTIVVVGKGLADGTVEVRDRRSGEREDVPVADAAAHVVRTCRS